MWKRSSSNGQTGVREKKTTVTTLIRLAWDLIGSMCPTHMMIISNITQLLLVVGRSIDRPTNRQLNNGFPVINLVCGKTYGHRIKTAKKPDATVFSFLHVYMCDISTKTVTYVWDPAIRLCICVCVCIWCGRYYSKMRGQNGSWFVSLNLTESKKQKKRFQ